ncbi:flagellar hook-length control protein FliK [Desulfobacter hydrogenophilus]|uniref:Flagellar hook-length control protein FliK n=1 Tax=Desulfobacter hydrogenophilus TaxID=2291 RepID=A0A328FIT7_9BACT|nr:flagellar hook-length control protein FliK [Desulfobacter hydrogenophilus]NDY70921.1 flagellar hook-length control protein FliK [Desulfobacter hydrogenophilus]QBH12837.1 flagellar hook-length control protein FliK [Desulfobacter hydrogenophilus]RAM03073.1 flagellar hook-length control protein FliK [Desulfobacter hydrogenophilus]
MLSNTSNINALMTGSSSDALMAATNSTVSTKSGFAISAFQEQLDKAIPQNSGMEDTSEVNAVGKNTGVGLSGDTRVQAEASPLANAQKPNLSTGEQNTEMSTVEKSNFIVRTTKQKISDIEDVLENGGGPKFLTELKNLLLSLSNGDLDNLSLDENGLEALGDLLVQAGFDQASVEALMSDLTLALEEKAGLISVSDFMDNLFELPLAEEEDITQAETLMPTSDLPYIKSLLSTMGVDEPQITSIMDNASEGSRGFDFDDFIEQLEQLLNTADESGRTYQTDGEDAAYTTLLKQLDLDSFIEESGTPLNLSTLINAFAQKLDMIEDNLSDQTEQSIPDMFTTDSFDALATQSGRHGLLNQLFSGLNLQEDSETTVNSAITLSANSDAMVKEIEGRIQVQFMDQIRGGDASTKTAADTQAVGNTVSTDMQTGETNSDNTFKIANRFSDTAGTTKESTSQMSIKAAQADAAALEKMASTTNSLSGETTSKNPETQPFIFSVEKSTTTSTLGTSGTQRTQQAFSTLPDFVTRQVGKSIVQSINTGNDTIRMQLKPSELGRVYMSIDHNGSSMKVSIITEHQSAKDILAANVNEIKTMLSSSGINLESFDVDMSSDFQQSMADARTQDQSAGKKQATRGAGDDTQEDATDNLTGQAAVINDGGSLHFVA